MVDLSQTGNAYPRYQCLGGRGSRIVCSRPAWAIQSHSISKLRTKQQLTKQTPKQWRTDVRLMSVSDCVLGWMSTTPWDETEQQQISSVSCSPCLTLGCKPLSTWGCCLLLYWIPISSSSLCQKILRFPSFLWTNSLKTWEFPFVQSRIWWSHLGRNHFIQTTSLPQWSAEAFQIPWFSGMYNIFHTNSPNRYGMGIKDYGKQ